VLRTAQAAENRSSWRRKWANRPVIWRLRADSFEAWERRGWENGGSTMVLLPNPFLWYRSAIVLEPATRQHLSVWARFVLFTSILSFCRFSTLLTRYRRRKPVD
jgi:hypothetical protein